MKRKTTIVSSATDRFVVVVDDDSRVRESIAGLLNSASIPVQSFAHASQAFRFLSRESVGCVITDIEMSGMGGWELQGLIADAYPDLPVIVVTGNRAREVRLARRLSVFAFMYKPFDGEELISTVIRGLQRSIDSLAKPP